MPSHSQKTYMKNAFQYSPGSFITGRFLQALVVLVALQPAAALGQRSSLLHRDLPMGEEGNMSLADSSWTFRNLPPPKEIRKHHTVHIRVDLKSQTFAEGQVERRKNALFDSILKDWVMLEGLKAIKPNPQSDGDQRIKGTINGLYRAESELESRESLKFDITAEVVDIRPNGRLVLEAHSRFRVNEEVWKFSLSGECSRDAIKPGDIVFSSDILHLDIDKQDRGIVYDGYRRGWLFRLKDRFRWF